VARRALAEARAGGRVRGSPTRSREPRAADTRPTTIDTAIVLFAVGGIFSLSAAFLSSPRKVWTDISAIARSLVVRNPGGSGYGT